MQLEDLKEDMGTQQKDLTEEICTVRREVSMQFFVEGVDLQFHASPFYLMLNVHAHFFEGDPNESLTSGRIQISTDFLTKTNGKVGGLSFKVGALDGKLDSLERRGMDLKQDFKDTSAALADLVRGVGRLEGSVWKKHGINPRSLTDVGDPTPEEDGN